MLQEEDPSGECHVRINDEPISSVESKPGYWDGPYNYLEKREDEKPIWVESTKGDKIDIHTIDLFIFAERYHGDWEEMKKHIRVEYDYLSNEREEDFWKFAKKECDLYNEINKDVEEFRKSKNES